MVYFVSVCYALSVGVLAVLFMALFADTLSGWVLAQAVLLLAYALRLGAFLVIRSGSAGFHVQLAHALELGRRSPLRLKLLVWIGVALLYALLSLPTLFIMTAQAHRLTIWSAPAGDVVMAAGLLLESIADWQKSRFNSRNPGRFCDTALYRHVRCPNYLGEILFWCGAWFSGVAGYTTALQWSLATAGFLGIISVMTDATRRLALKQAAEYGADPVYRAYATRVPVLLPLLPIYSLRAAAVPRPSVDQPQ